MNSMKQALNDLVSAMAKSDMVSLELLVDRTGGSHCPEVKICISTARLDENGLLCEGSTLCAQEYMDRDDDRRHVLADQEELLLALSSCLKEIEDGAKAQKATASEGAALAKAACG